ncbi:FMN-binding protein [Amycolatopsis rhizosphaerae]|uniref:FMN-binding protein n=1 Tax=Amycolatopsis rhizosphaerae TaxID=2053003 RepID=A0A558DD03_9PSEU|nr:FMN-binding protein [Amycolatopsis rhizosphaerae]TVT58803.1 FMN-binding protein [Amycolatopsis rhizosphaerae]
MRRVVIVVLLTIAGLVPLLRYHPASSPASALSGNSTPATEAPLSSPSPSTSSSAPKSAPPSGAGGGGRKVVNGSTVDTEYGPYQVQVTFAGNKITDVRITTEPDDRHSQRIANSAEPTLREEALQAQSAHIDTVSGATTTSEAYAESLQAAIDQRGN